MRPTPGTLLTRLALAAVLAMATGASRAAETEDTREIVPTGSFSGAFLAARAAEADDDLESATVYYRRALAFDPDSQALQQSMLVGLISQGAFDDALSYAEDLKEVPEVERFSRLALAVDALRKDEFGEAEDWLELVLESDLDRLITDVMTSWARAGGGDVDGALAHLDEIEGPEWYWLFVNYHRALINAHAERDAEAEEAFEEVIGNKAAGAGAPDTYMRAMEAYAAYLAGREETDRALEVLDRADAFVSGRASVSILRERIEAGDDVELPVASAGDGASEVLLNLASALGRSGGESFVRLYLQYALALRPQSDAVIMQLASLDEQQDDPEGAIEHYESIGAESPWQPVVQLQIGLNLADLERHDEAIDHLKAALERDPEELRAYLALGGVYSSQKDFRSAAEVYERAVEHIDEPRREHWNIFYQRGIAYERLKEWDRAEPNFKQALELYPDHPQVLNYLGYSWVDMDMNLEEGLDLIEKAVELRPRDGYIVDSLGWAYFRLGRFEDAVQELERAVSLMPEDPVLNDHLGDAYWRVGRRLEATFQWAHARDLDPEPDILAQVEQKLAEGLPPADGVRLAEAISEDGRLETASDAEHVAGAEELTAAGGGEDAGDEAPADGKEEDDASEVTDEERDDGEAAADEEATDEERDDGATAEEEAADEERDDGAAADGEITDEEREDGNAADGKAGEEARDDGEADSADRDAEADAEMEADAGATTRSPEPMRHTVRRGQSLWSIAAEMFGSGVRYGEILELNPELRANPDYIRPGQSLRVPEVE